MEEIQVYINYNPSQGWYKLSTYNNVKKTKLTLTLNPSEAENYL